MIRLRPPEFEDYSLYDFIRLTTVQKLNDKTRERLVKANCRSSVPVAPVEADGELAEDDRNEGGNGDDPVISVPNEDDDEDDSPPFAAADGIECDGKLCYEFMPGHPNRKTHAVFKIKK